MSSLIERRARLLKDWRNEQVQSSIKKQRYNILHMKRHDELDMLVQSTCTMINKEQMEMLVSYANEDYANAIIHIGNLLIDEVLVVEEIMGKLEWAGKCVYWSWLARVMIEKRYCDARMINMCCKMIKLAKEKQHLKSPLLALNQIVNVWVINKERANGIEMLPTIHNIDRFMLALLHCTKRPQITVSFSSYALLEKLFVLSLEMFMLRNSIFQNRLIESLMHGLLSNKVKIKAKCTKIVHILSISSIFWRPVTIKLFQMMDCIDKPEEQGVRVEILLFWRQFIQKAELSELLNLLDQQLVSKVGQYYKIASQLHQPKHGELCLQIFAIVRKRLYQQHQRGFDITSQKMFKLNLLSDVIQYENHETVSTPVYEYDL